MSSPRSLRLGIFLGVAVGIVVAFVVRTNFRRKAPHESDVTEAAPPVAPAANEATKITRARKPAPPTAAPRPEALPADDEAGETARARDIARSDPDKALALLDDADRTHPDGGLAEARAALRVDALVAARRIGPARDAAEVYLARYPSGPQAQRIEMLTGVHPRPTEPAD
jgi:hypothetical protein